MTGRSLLLRAALLGLVFFVAALALLPARWLMVMLPVSWPVAVVDASGTVWGGQATLAIGPLDRRRSLPEPVRWHWTLSGGLKLRVTHPWLGGPLVLSPAWNGIGLSAQSLQLPASALSTLDARVAAVDPRGELTLKWPATFIGAASRPPGAELLDAQWLNAASALTPIRPLGNYHLTMRQSLTNGADLALDTRRGPLMLAGTGAVNANGHFTFDGSAHADPSAGPDTHAALRDLLAALGPTKNNETTLRFR